MVEAGRITLRVEIDAKQFESIIKKLKLDMKDFKTQVDNTTPGIQKLGDTATTTAVRFQTLTQGTINLVTSFTQAYTSISNLQKAKTSLQAAAVGVERAIDLQRRKQFQLNQELAKAAPNYQKVELLTRELETAHDDLAVKQQRVKDATDQVSDTYVLFALNIANVGFSAIQTGASMIKMAEGTKVAAAASTLLNKSMGRWALIATSVIVGIELLAQGIKTFNKELGTSISIIDNISRLMGDWGSATDITLDNYESKINSASSATSQLGSEWSNLTTKTRNEVNEQSRLLVTWRQNYLKTINDVKYNLNELSGFREAELRGGSQGNFTQAQSGVNIPANAAYAIRGVNVTADIYRQLESIFSFLVPNVPYAQAQEYVQSNNLKIDDNTSQFTPTVQKRLQTARYFGSLPFPMQSSQINMYTPTIQNFAATSMSTKDYIPFTGATFLEYNLQTTLQDYANNQKLESLKSKYSSTMQKFKTGEQTIEKLKQLQAQADDPSVYDAQIRFETRLLGRLANQAVDLDAEIQIFELDMQIKASEVAPKNYGDLGSFRQQAITERERIKAEKNKVKVSEFIYQGKVSFPFERISGGYQLARQEGRKIFYAGIGGRTIAEGMLAGAFFGQGTAGMGRKVVDTPMMRALEQAQLEYQAKYGPRVPVPGRTNVDFQKMYLEMTGQSTSSKSLPEMVNYINRQRYTSNAEDLASYGAVSTLGTNYAARTRFGQAAVSSGMVSVSEVQGGAIRFAQRNAQALTARRREIAREDAWRNSVVGQNAQAAYAALTGTSFAYSRNVARRGGGISGDLAISLRTAGLLGIGTSYTAFETTASDIAGSVLPQLDAFIKEKGLREEFLYKAMSAVWEQSVQAVKRTLPIGWSGIRNGGRTVLDKPIWTLAQQGLNRYVSRVAAGNFGEYDATLLNAMTGASVGELAHEYQVFTNKIVPILGIAHNDFKTTLVDPKRGINEIDDRIRWTQRLEQISTGATVF